MMKRVGGLVVAVVVVLFAEVCSAQTAQNILERVKRKYDSINDAELKFSQHVRFEVSKLEQNVSGTLVIKKENKYRVETEGRTIVTDGVTVWSYSQATNQVLIDRYKGDERAMTPENILAVAPKDYYASILGKEKVGGVDARLLKLVPKDENSLVRTMKAWVDESTWLIRKVEIVDVNDKTTMYVVSDMKVNTGIPDSRFAYQIPDGAEAVDLR
ncbi:MAG: outer membrane lipoprotein carrier protein LolA [Bacteroidetes bacterium]|nr:outer membrane lipoprotein carrier protein LolA [Bacteroidota bacterium]MCW5894049.1 outer membrane lipoprotein carrier protein LolA [Bacteroidota bacterium]